MLQEELQMYEKCWLSYKQIHKSEKGAIWVFYKEADKIVKSAFEELRLGFGHLYNRECIKCEETQVEDFGISFKINSELKSQSYHLFAKDGKCIIEGADSRGILYGAFELLRMVQVEALEEWEELSCDKTCVPDNPMRILNHWDNMDGTIERGYSGNSFFFEENTIIINERTKDYARLISSVGMNTSVINNVNVKHAATYLITDRYFNILKEMSEIFSAYGIDLYISINYAAPIELGGLDSADPLDEKVQAWWKEKAKEVWANVPLLGGFLVKADSEGRPGPFTYGRDHSQGANILADALAPFGAKVIWRCFVYNCTQDWRDTKTDRAKAAFDNFRHLDGKFRENVILQIKNGPMDFQVREPVSPLFGALEKTNMILEVQIAKE